MRPQLIPIIVAALISIATGQAVRLVPASYPTIQAAIAPAVSGDTCNTTGTPFPDPLSGLDVLDALTIAQHAAGLLVVSCC